jgi:hypothetical protein
VDNSELHPTLYCTALNALTLSLGLNVHLSVQDSKVGPSMIMICHTVVAQKESMKEW